MTPVEKKKLLKFFAEEDRWCRDAEACDARGNFVKFSDSRAVAWDLTGGLCRLFGWKRASVLFVQIERHLLGRGDCHSHAARGEIPSMVALQAYNDREDLTFQELSSRLASIPVWRRGHAKGPAPEGDRLAVQG